MALVKEVEMDEVDATILHDDTAREHHHADPHATTRETDTTIAEIDALETALAALKVEIVKRIVIEMTITIETELASGTEVTVTEAIETEETDK